MTPRQEQVQVLTLEESVACLRVAGRLIWSLHMSDVGVIGEYTTDNGPWLDDRFVVFVRRNGTWFEAPVHAGFEEFLERLSAHLGCPVASALVNKTDFTSRVMWPPVLAGRPLLSFTATKVSWLRRVTGLRRRRLELSPEVSSALASS